MEEIAELFIELLKKHDRVSLPGMGAFVASPQAAVIEKGKIIPPSKKVTFRKSETWNDGLLEQLYAERHGLGMEKAREELYRIIADLRFELDANGKVALPRLGTLRQSASREVSFVLAKSLNLHKDSYGLDEVKFTSNTEGKQGEKAGQASKIDNIPLFVLFCAMLAVISALVLFFLLNRIRSKDSVEALIGIPDEPQQELSVGLPEQDVDGYSPDDVSPPAPEDAPENQPAPPEASTLPPEAEKAPPPANTRCEFCTVVASYNTFEGARIRAEKYKNMGYNARVVESESNRFRVALGCYSTLGAAKQGIAEASKFVKGAWILEVCR